MNNTPPPDHSSSIDAIFVQLNQHDIEEFYTGYQCWNLLQQIAALQTKIGDLHRQIAENTQHMQAVQPTAIALATLARLQSNGVNDIELLDRMLEQGEIWMDRTMQRLEYFEHLNDFISDDYSQWCQLALEGAYDWIDSMLDGGPPPSPPEATSKDEKLTEATEELFLQKLSSEIDEDETPLLETTQKRTAITLAHPSELLPRSEDISVSEERLIVEETAGPDAGQPMIRENLPRDPSDDVPDLLVEEPPFQEIITRVEQSPVESSSISDIVQSSIQECVEDIPVTTDNLSTPPDTLHENEEHLAPEAAPFESKKKEILSSKHRPKALVQHAQNKPQKQPNLIRRLIGTIWGSGKS